MASIANYEFLFDEYARICTKHSRQEISLAYCEGFQFGFSQCIQNFAFALVYLAQAELNYAYEDVEVLKPDRMFTAMFSLLFGVFGFVQATSQIQDKDRALENARKMF